MSGGVWPGAWRRLRPDDSSRSSTEVSNCPADARGAVGSHRRSHGRPRRLRSPASTRDRRHGGDTGRWGIVESAHTALGCTPTRVVRMDVRENHVVNLVGRNSERGKFIRQRPADTQPSPEGRVQRPDARVDQRESGPRPDQEAVASGAPSFGGELLGIPRGKGAGPARQVSPVPSKTSVSGTQVSTSRIAVISTSPTVSVAAGMWTLVALFGVRHWRVDAKCASSSG